jgi:hypothetical protein
MSICLFRFFDKPRPESEFFLSLAVRGYGDCSDASNPHLLAAGRSEGHNSSENVHPPKFLKKI